MNDSYKLITPIISALFVREQERLNKALCNLHASNKEAWGKQGDGFIFEGEVYVPAGVPNGKRQNLPLHGSMIEEVRHFASDRRKIGEDSKLISQLLFKLYEPCGNTGHLLQDIRDATPECIIDIMADDIKALGRVREPVALLNHPRDWRFYERVLPTIEFYSAARFIY